MAMFLFPLRGCVLRFIAYLFLMVIKSLITQIKWGNYTSQWLCPKTPNTLMVQNPAKKKPCPLQQSVKPNSVNKPNSIFVCSYFLIYMYQTTITFLSPLSSTMQPSMHHHRQHHCYVLNDVHKWSHVSNWTSRKNFPSIINHYPSLSGIKSNSSMSMQLLLLIWWFRNDSFPRLRIQS